MNRNNNQDHVLGLQSCLLMLILICLLTLSDPGCLSDFTGGDGDVKSEQNIENKRNLKTVSMLLSTCNSDQGRDNVVRLIVDCLL